MKEYKTTKAINKALAEYQRGKRLDMGNNFFNQRRAFKNKSGINLHQRRSGGCPEQLRNGVRKKLTEVAGYDGHGERHRRIDMCV